MNHQACAATNSDGGPMFADCPCRFRPVDRKACAEAGCGYCDAAERAANTAPVAMVVTEATRIHAGDTMVVILPENCPEVMVQRIADNCRKQRVGVVFLPHGSAIYIKEHDDVATRSGT